MDAQEQHHHEEEHHVIGLIPSIIVLVALAIAVVWYSIYSAVPHH